MVFCLVRSITSHWIWGEPRSFSQKRSSQHHHQTWNTHVHTFFLNSPFRNGLLGSSVTYDRTVRFSLVSPVSIRLRTQVDFGSTEGADHRSHRLLAHEDAFPCYAASSPNLRPPSIPFFFFCIPFSALNSRYASFVSIVPRYRPKRPLNKVDHHGWWECM